MCFNSSAGMLRSVRSPCRLLLLYAAALEIAIQRETTRTRTGGVAEFFPKDTTPSRKVSVWLQGGESAFLRSHACLALTQSVSAWWNRRVGPAPLGRGKRIVKSGDGQLKFPQSTDERLQAVPTGTDVCKTSRLTQRIVIAIHSDSPIGTGMKSGSIFA